MTFYFLPADMVTQILNFGLPAPIDVQVQGNDVNASLKVADVLLQRFREVPGLGDLRIQQPADQPKLHVTVDRTKASQAGLTQQNVASSMLVTLSGSFQTQPTFWLNPQNGVSYNVAVQAPQYSVQSLQDLQNIPIALAVRDAP
ncbi:MAG: efflux RND transporter permease subunit [Ignavibacteriota bacterium]